MIFAFLSFRASPNAGLWASALVLMLASLENARAHLELYHNVEVNLTEAGETGVMRLYITIHAPELLVGFDNAGSEVFDAEWLRSRSNEEFQVLFEKSRDFVKGNFSFRIDDGPVLALGEKLHFENPKTIRDKSYQSGVPVGCLLVTADLKLKPGMGFLEVGLSEKAGKRLLLVTNRKGKFPEAKDMDTGDKVRVALPERRGQGK